MKFGMTFLMAWFLSFSEMVVVYGQGVRKVGGIDIPTQIKVGNQTLYLNGAGVREKWWIDLYVGALYVAEKKKDADALVNQDAVTVMRLHIVSSLVTRDRMMSSIEEGFHTALGGKVGPYQERIERLKGFFTKELRKGDVVELRYIPERGTEVYLNETRLGTISGLDFKKALFSIWLGPSPVDKTLKEALLGNAD